jgi:hypothetical protein
MTVPHENVYTRLGISRISGVGVLAIVDIPKGTFLFTGDESEMKWFKEEKLELHKLPEEIRRLYKDFCVIKTENGVRKYGCPTNFNNMTISWYLNNIKDTNKPDDSQTILEPNVGCNSEYEFYTLSDIKAGEELIVDYDTYSER